MDLVASIVIETFTHGEGSSWKRVSSALAAATRMAQAHGSAEVIALDASDEATFAERVAAAFPDTRIVAVAGLGYEDMKTRGVEEARGEHVIFLDGDCIPDDDAWLSHHLRGLEAHVATGGFTRYDRGFLGALESVLDFGFMLPPASRPLGCYASNNSGWRRSTWLDSPVPPGALRSRCFAHAQLLRRKGTPVWMVPQARVHHERQPFLRERVRQGYDAVGASWVDPQLPERRLLRFGVLVAPLFYARAVAYDWARLWRGRRDLELSPVQAAGGTVLLPLMRLADLTGMVRALSESRRTYARVASAT